MPFRVFRMTGLAFKRWDFHLGCKEGGAFGGREGVEVVLPYRAFWERRISARVFLLACKHDVLSQPFRIFELPQSAADFCLYANVGPPWEAVATPRVFIGWLSA